MRGKRRTHSSMAEVARRAGVSLSTVSRALSGSPLISEETRRLVRQDVACILDRPGDGMWRQFRPAAQARPESGAFSLCGVTEEAAVLAPGHPDLAHRPAVDAGRGDADEEAAVEARVAGL